MNESEAEEGGEREEMGGGSEGEKCGREGGEGGEGGKGDEK